MKQIIKIINPNKELNVISKVIIKYIISNKNITIIC